MNSPIIYIDVDDTIVRSFGSKRIPMILVIEKIKELNQLGFEMYCWSYGGADYAKKICDEFGVVDCFKCFLPKPNLLVDDQDINDWNFLIKEFPQNFSGLSKEVIIKKMNIKKE